MCDVAGELGLGLLGSGGIELWPELMPRLLELVEDAEVAHRESSLYVLGILSCFVVEQAPPQVPVLRDVYAKRMQDPELTSQREALCAAAVMVHAITSADMRDLFVPLVPPMLSVIAKALNAGDEDTAVDALSSMVDMVDSHPALFRSHLPTILDATLSLTAAKGLEDQVRLLGIELLVSLAEKVRRPRAESSPHAAHTDTHTHIHALPPRAPSCAAKCPTTASSSAWSPLSWRPA